MPIYEYRCEICKGIKEKFQHTFDAEPPLCCGVSMVRLPANPAYFKMKGEGGYPSLRKAYQAGGRNLVEDAKKAKRWV